MDKYSVNTRLNPTQVITIYNDPGKRRYYLEHRHVKSVAGKLTLQAAAPLGEDVFRNIAAAFVKQSAANLKFEGLLQEHILYGHSDLGQVAVIWYRPATMRMLNLSEHIVGKGFNKPVGTPATLYVLLNGSLFVFALMTDERPSVTTKLYYAPFTNIYADGRVCLGTARVGKKTSTFEGEAERYERAFYMAEQSGSGAGVHTKTPIQDLYPALAKSGKPFPSKAELAQHGKYRTLNDLITGLIRKR